MHNHAYLLKNLQKFAKSTQKPSHQHQQQACAIRAPESRSDSLNLASPPSFKAVDLSVKLPWSTVAELFLLHKIRIEDSPNSLVRAFECASRGRSRDDRKVARRRRCGCGCGCGCGVRIRPSHARLLGWKWSQTRVCPAGAYSRHVRGKRDA